VVICVERGADLHMAQLMPLPLTVSCFSKIQIGFTFLVPAHPGSPGQKAVKRVCMCVCVGDICVTLHTVHFLNLTVKIKNRLIFDTVTNKSNSVSCYGPPCRKNTDETRRREKWLTAEREACS